MESTTWLLNWARQQRVLDEGRWGTYGGDTSLDSGVVAGGVTYRSKTFMQSSVDRDAMSAPIE